MRTFKYLMVIFIVLILTKTSLTQDGDPPPVVDEVGFKNNSIYGRNLEIVIYPVSMIMNSNGFYDLHTKYGDNTGNTVYNYATTGNRSRVWDTLNQTWIYSTVISHTLNPGNSVGFQHERDAQSDGSQGIFAYGMYKVEFHWGIGTDTCLIEFDASNFGDLNLIYYDDSLGGGPRIMYTWPSTCGERNINATNKHIKSWEDNWCGTIRAKNYGNYVYTDDENNTYTLLPQDFRQDCGNESFINANFLGGYGTGRLSLNLTIDKNIRTRLFIHEGERYEAPTQIVISQGCTLKVNPACTVSVLYDSEISQEPSWYNQVYLKENSVLLLYNGNAQLKIENSNWLVLECYSKLVIGNGSKVIMEGGSRFCNRGGRISGAGQFIVQGIVKFPSCNISPCTDNIVDDSVKFVIDEDATFEIPDSTSYIFEGTETALTCKDNSTIKFGKGSKLIFQDGARINANNCRFVSYDSSDVWSGIYLSGLSRDTLRNCTFQNAASGINIENKVISGINDPVPATLIENCTFKNSTSTAILNCVYANNSQNVLVKGCDMVKTSTGGFTSAFIVEYCPVNGVIIVDNTVNYAETGITVIQSSPYIARNTLNGITNTGIGISLDNSNGTIEYNRVYNYDRSVSCYYSSPYMFKNTFSDAQTKNMELTAYSVPVMRPVVSGSTLLWLGGNNFISGEPTEAGITFEEYAYPMMDSGYNVTNVNGSVYMSGILASFINFTVNNWYDDPPEQSLFDVSGSSFEYNPAYDGSELPGTDYYDLNSLGFGLYDTVFVKDLGDNPSAASLFMQAYNNEMNGNYVIAVNKYKNVISDYRTSFYAPVSLSRIFNCLEKANSPVSVYQTAQSYYNSIRSDTSYPAGVRETSEDYRIKSKVKQGMIEDAISDYNTIYQNYPNTSKGLHALLNAMCLTNMIQGDNTQGTAGSNEHKANILALILGKDIKNDQTRTNSTLPFAFKLHQNYPNPFNPITMIKYDIPADNAVTIKVYDLLGREVFTLNEYKTAGSYEVRFDGTNLASGLYFYELVVGDNTNNGEFRDVKKMVLLK